MVRYNDAAACMKGYLRLRGDDREWLNDGVAYGNRRLGQ